VPIRSGGQAPYAPPQAVIEFIRSYRNRPLQTPFTGEVLSRAGVSESLIPRVIASMKALDLIDEGGMPTSAFEGLRRAPEAEYSSRLAEVVKAAYAEVFEFFDPARDDEEKARDIFRHYEPIGQLTRIASLFLGLCEEAGIIAERKRTAPKSATPRATSTSSKKPEPSKRASSTRQGSPSAGTSTKPLTGVGASTGRFEAGDGVIPPALMGLLSSLPSPEVGWTSAQRKRFMDAFSAVLDFSIPISEPESRQPVGPDYEDDE
jgi:hypothetical protein